MKRPGKSDSDEDGSDTSRPGRSVSPPKTHKFSVVRMGGVAAGVAVCALGAVAIVDSASSSFEPDVEVQFAPYVDVTLTPVSYFEDPLVNPASTAMLGFVVADRSDPCLPTWGTYYTMDAAGRALDLDRRVVRLNERDGDVGISFGGQANVELAVGCTDQDLLLQAYRSVYERYEPTVLDFDLEGDALLDDEANKRRAAALKLLQDETGVDIWLTIPLAGHGLLDTGITAVDALLEAGVELDIINLMAMNFGGSREAADSMGEASSKAITAAYSQLALAYDRVRYRQEEAELWDRIGATVMIGQNDVASDRFETSDAHHLVAFAAEVGLGQLAMWSLNRDVPCGEGIPDGSLSNTCSGVKQSIGEFGSILSSATVRSSEESSSSSDDGDDDSDSSEVLALDDERLSPYPIWRANRSYSQGAKVVWQSRVYQAKWWSDGGVPGASVDNVWDTPWRYLGPVTEADLEMLSSESDTDDDQWELWRSETIFLTGDEVEYKGEVFRAGWWSQGDEPQADHDQPYDHPWVLLGHFEAAPREGEAAEDEAERVFVEAGS